MRAFICINTNYVINTNNDKDAQWIYMKRMYNSYDGCDDKILNFAPLEPGPEFQTGFLPSIRIFLVSPL